MLFIRISDYADIYTFNKPFKFLNNKRKGNIVKKFIIDKTIQGKIKIFEDELQSKMIPKKSINILKGHPIKTLVLPILSAFVKIIQKGTSVSPK